MIVVWSNFEQTHKRHLPDDEIITLIHDLLKSNPEPPAMVEIYDERNGTSFAMGIGRAETVITYQGSLDPPYFISMGDPSRSGTVEFCYGEEASEYMASSLIPLESGLAALKEFLSNKQRPSTIDWERL